MKYESRRQFLEAAAAVTVAAWTGGSILGCSHRVIANAAPAAPASPAITGDASLKVRAAAHGALYGCAVDTTLLGRDAVYRQLLIDQAAIVVAENAMKWGPMRPSSSTYNFADADTLVAFAEQNHMKVRGHNLCWHRQLPRWFAAEATTANARMLLTEHIQKVAGRYAGRMHSWDVVNEAIEVKDGRQDGLRDSPWLKLVGDDFIEVAFRTAREADPHALLTYNDYGIEVEDAGSAKKRAAVLELVRRMKARRVPLDAVGVQSHIQCGSTYGAGLAEFMKEVRELGLEIFVTEMDVNDRKLPADPAMRDQQVAELYGSYTDLVLRDPALKAVLTWGITDRRTWLNGEDAREDHLPERCLLFGELDGKADQPKEAFFAMRKAFDQRRAV